jgi:hypothetical protein
MDRKRKGRRGRETRQRGTIKIQQIEVRRWPGKFNSTDVRRQSCKNQGQSHERRVG